MITKPEIEKSAEHFACGQVFYNYPFSMPYEEILYLIQNSIAWDIYNEQLENIEDDDNQLHVCEEFEAENFESIINRLENFKEAYIYEVTSLQIKSEQK